ncbi:MAG: hypothetical protein CSA50_04435 [Gammaproteobacteria bacterium]|nr:MAG: hypothetical protein CSA50_04435 [Gammaproteobacteria bacterium]
MDNVLEISKKMPIRLVQISLAFSLVNFFVQGLSWNSFLLFVLFTLSVYVSAQVIALINSPELKMIPEVEALKSYLLTLFGLFVMIATCTYSCLFGVFYLAIGLVYLISPYDRDWLLGQSKLVVIDNKIEYQKETV